MRIQVTVHNPRKEHKDDATGVALEALTELYGAPEKVKSIDSGVARETTFIFKDPGPIVKEEEPIEVGGPATASGVASGTDSAPETD